MLITSRPDSARPLSRLTAAAVRAGFAAVMIREKTASAAEVLHCVQETVELCRGTATGVLVNDRLDVALAVPACGVHLGAQGIPVADARKLLGPDRLLGYSAHNPEEANQALTEGADYVTLSPVFNPGSKPGVRGRGLEWFRECLADIPPHRVLALGGINRSNLTDVAGTGCAGAAMVGALAQSTEPEREAEALAQAWVATAPLNGMKAD